jgi:hypothetical protein
MRRLIALTCLLVIATAIPAAAVLLVPTLEVEPLTTVAGLGSSITVGGTLTDPADTADLPIVVERSPDGTTWTPVDGSPATTAFDGTFQASDTPPDVDTYTYRASWEGDGGTYGYGEATSTQTLTVLLVPALEVEPLTTVATVGSSITVAGTLTDPADTADLPIVVERSPDGTTWTPVDGSPATTASDGTFQASDTPPDVDTYTYRASWVGDGAAYTYGEATSTQTLALLPISTLSVEPEVTSSHVGQDVNISGAITDPSDVGAGASVTITRSSNGSTYDPIANSPATTDMNGAFTVTDAPPLGTYTYRAQWGGDGVAHGSGSTISTTSLTVSKWGADLTLAASKTKIVYGSAVRLSGAWSSGSGAQPTDPSVTLSRSKSGGGTVERSTGLDVSDTYKLRETPPAGTFTYTAAVAADDTHEAATSVSVDVVVTKRSTALSLSVTHGTITYGDRTRLVATLKRGKADSEVRFEKKSGAGWKAIDTVPVSSGGVARLRVSPNAKKTYRAVFEATANLKASASDTVTVRVHPVMVSRMIGTFTRVGDYAVYKCCTAFFYVKLKPIHPRLSWTATVQYHGDGKWRPLGSGSYHFQSNGGSGIYLNSVTGYRYRVRGHFDGDGDHLGATSAWNYFKFKG